jgi:hypothetical protein
VPALLWEIAADYTKIGMIVDCPKCRERTELNYAMGSTIPLTGWSVSFSSFAQLLENPAYRKRIGPMIEAWFECEVQVAEDGVHLKKKGGAFLVREHVHEAIQADGKRQQPLYQAAMDLWR